MKYIKLEFDWILEFNSRFIFEMITLHPDRFKSGFRKLVYQPAAYNDQIFASNRLRYVSIEHAQSSSS